MKIKKSSITSIFVEMVGWYGALAIIVAYALLQFGLFRVDNLLYQLLNLTGSIGIIVDTIRKKDYQPMVLNFIWLIVAAVAIVGSARFF